MSILGRAQPVASGAVSAATCAHCGARLAPGQDRFCCTGCAGAHALVAGLGLTAFYGRREAEAGALRPEALAPGLDLAPFAAAQKDGTQRLELVLSGLTCGACV